MEQIIRKINALEAKIQPTIDIAHVFEINCRNQYMIKNLEDRLAVIKRHESYIGKEVYKYKKNIIFKDTLETDYFNPLEETPILFTKEMFNNFQKNIIERWIERYTNDLITRPLSERSTFKLANLQYEWYRDCDQELIAFFKELLDEF